MKVQGFLGGTYRGRSTNFVSDRSVNLFPELSASPDPKDVVAMFGTPGTALFSDLGVDPIRGAHTFNNTIFAVSGDTLYSVSSGGVATLIGTLGTSTGPVQMEDNGLLSGGVGGNQLAIVDGTNLYIYNVVTAVLSTVSLTFSPIAITYIDGYFVAVAKDSMSAYCSDLYDGTVWNGLATSAISATPDNLMSCCSPRQELWFVKSYSTEVWYDAGVATSTGFPFQRISGAVVDVGTAAVGSVVVGNNGIFMLAQERSGQDSHLVGVVQFSGYAPSPIMPPQLVYEISQLERVDDAIAWVYSSEGHTFYIITFPTGDMTLVYDTTTQMWHERSSYVTPNKVGRHMMNSLCRLGNKLYVGSYLNGKIYEMGGQYTTDDGDPIISMRVTPSLFDKKDMEYLFIHRLVVDIEGGVGDSAGSVPAAELSWSNDGGHTWSNPYPASMGKQGEYKKDLRWRRLGKSKNRVWRLMMSDASKRAILGATVEVSK